MENAKGGVGGREKPDGLHRLAKSAYREKFVLKGGLLIYGMKGRMARPTRDIDLLGSGLPNEPEALASIFQDLCRMKAGDGVRFDVESIESEGIAENADYEGVRIKVLGFLERSRQRLQIDIAFGDVVTPSPIEIDYPTLLDMEPLHLRAYSWESVIAEKFEAMVKLADVKNRQWTAFLRRTKLEGVPQILSEVLGIVQAMLRPIHHASCEGRTFRGTWEPDQRFWRIPPS